MKRVIPALLLVGAILVTALLVFLKPAVVGAVREPARAGEKEARPQVRGKTKDTQAGSAPAAARDSAEVKRLLDEARAAMRRGAYRDARRSLDAVLAIAPDDPWAQLYRSLCEQRVEAASPFAPLSPSQLTALNERLRQEEAAQRRASAKQKVLERTIRQEQARWDQELAALQRQAERAEQLKRQQAEADAIARARTERAKEQEREQQEALRRAQRAPDMTRAAPPEEQPRPAPAAEVLAPERPAAPSPEAPAETPLAREEARRAVELSPVKVPTGGPQEEGQPPISPSLVGRVPPPPGAVQINARQMHVEPDRKIAIAEGDVEVEYGNAFLTCDHLTLFTDTKDVYAEGRVRLEEGNQVFRGELVHYNFDAKKGRFLEGTISSPPWHEHGRSLEHLAEGVYEVRPGYITSCELEPPHFRFQGSRAIVFSQDKVARSRHVTLAVEQFPLIYLPWLSVADRQTPFFLIPGKKKPWEQFVLMGYRYELPESHRGTLHLDWRRAFAWGTGVSHQFNNKQLGKGLLRLYYNDEHNMRRKEDDLPKGAGDRRFRVLWRHDWRPTEDTSILTNIQKFSDADFRKEFLFREEFVQDDAPESFISAVRSTKDFNLAMLLRQRMNRFETITETFPQLTFDTGEKPIGETQAFSQTSFEIANFQTKRAHSDNDTDAIRVDWFQQIRYALGLFRPIEVTPRAGIRQTYHTKDIQSGATATPATDRYQGRHDVISGQASMGVDASLKLFRIFPVTANPWGLNINWLRHVLTPTVGYAYIHQPTVPSSLLGFSKSEGHKNQLTLGLENKLQTRRALSRGAKPQSVDLLRYLISLPYTFRGNANKAGGRLGDWTMTLELFPWSWMRLESTWEIPSHFVEGARDDRIKIWNVDLVMVGGRGELEAAEAHDIQAPQARAYHPGPRGGIDFLTPPGEWYLGLGHRYSQNDKTESVLEFDWRPSPKWEIGTFHRLTWKEVSGTAKRFGNVREYQYTLRRDLHDWVAELVYRVDREFGEEFYFTLTLKAYPELPIEIGESYHQPKIGSQYSPFSPVGR